MTSEAIVRDMLPRGSLGSHHPYAVQIRWYAMTIVRIRLPGNPKRASVCESASEGRAILPTRLRLRNGGARASHHLAAVASTEHDTRRGRFPIPSRHSSVAPSDNGGSGGDGGGAGRTR